MRTIALVALGLLVLPTSCSSESTAPARTSTTSAAPARSNDAKLIDAADAGDTAEVTRLLAAGATVRATDEDGRSALVVAAYGAHVDVAQRLIEAGADVNLQDETRQSAYLIATSEIGEAKGLELLELTLAHGADVRALDSYNGTGLIRAAERGFAAIVERLLRAGVDPNHVNRLGWTALLEAIILGSGGERHTAVVRALLAGGADPNVADRDGTMPLAHARERGQASIVALLTNR